MKKSILLLTALLTCFYGYSQTAEEYLALGKEKAADGDFKSAIWTFSAVLESDQNNEIAYFYRGLAKSKLLDFRGAISDYNEAIVNSSSNKFIALAYYWKADAKYQLKDYSGAILDYNRLIELEEIAKPVYYFERARCKFHLEDYRGAISDCTKTIELSNDFADAYYIRGLARTVIGQKESGCMDLSKAGELGLEVAYESIKDFCN